ncbi:putative transglycosylase [Gluconacetobacter diazotrophicus PA1 5]|uniref:Putative transglycosylase n=2 Tax=Gluconacetobacter diazotrophicus TaxID=33996 RepID=A9HH45_GLUDA|nr:putative transglycosylase [Gluconacetobacter diazotrophicus PA1 5]
MAMAILCSMPGRIAGKKTFMVARNLDMEIGMDAMPIPCLRRRSRMALITTAILVHPVWNASARSPQASLCVEATTQAERALHIPDGFLAAMSRVESGRPEPDGMISAWPWTITVNGVGHYYMTREDAIAAVQMFRQQGNPSIDVGCMQVNLQQHPDAFSTLDQAFDPVRNARYAATFLLKLHDKMGSWPRAAAAYHSQTPGIGTPYQWKVLEAWAVPQDGRDPQISPRKDARAAPYFAAQTFPRPLVPALAPHQPVMAAAPAGMTTTPVRAFHPFVGNRNFAPPSPNRPVTKGTQGRTLASYRAAPVALVAPRRLAPQPG